MHAGRRQRVAVAGQTSLPWRLSPSVTDSVGPAGAGFARAWSESVPDSGRPARDLARLIWPGVRDGVAVWLLVALAAVAARPGFGCVPTGPTVTVAGASYSRCPCGPGFGCVPAGPAVAVAGASCSRCPCAARLGRRRVDGRRCAMRGRLVCGLVAAVAGVAVSAAGAGGARASLSPGPGSQLWVARYHGPSNTGDASSVAVSPDGGRVFVTGVSQGSTSGLDYATVAYNAATGARLWVTRYSGPGNGYDTASSVAVSPGGRTVFVTGESQGSTSGLDYATVAYNAATGARLWVTRYNGPGDGEDGAKSVAVSPGGGVVFVTGYSQGTAAASGLDYATVAYNAATGARLWVTRYDGPGNGRDFAHALAVSPGGGTVFVTGQSKAGAQGDYATVAYNAATGAQLWAALYHGPATGQDAAFSVAVSPGGGAVYVTGASKATASGLDYEYATVAYNAATGAQRWAARTP